ncbi:MAG: hypothetical protein IJA10_13015 [Lachnospiraceae bacterium]|nr:hypothetical protein [Lachnospiraceae bacterium]
MGENTDVRAKDAYDMQQIIRFHHAWCCTPEGGISRDFDAPLFGGELIPIKCECMKNENGEVMNISDMEEEHLEIMIVAVQVNLCLYTIQINKMMKYYTTDERVLELALIAEKLYKKNDLLGSRYAKEKIISSKNLLGNLSRNELTPHMTPHII